MMKNKIMLIITALLLAVLSGSLGFIWTEYEWFMAGAGMTFLVLMLMLADICVMFVNYEALQTEKMYSKNEYEQILQRISKDISRVNKEINNVETYHGSYATQGSKYYNLHNQLMEYKKELIEERKDIEKCIKDELKAKRKGDNKCTKINN